MKIDFLKDSSKFFLFRVAVSIGWMSALIILTRLLEPGEYGTFVLLNSIILLSSIFSTTWISASILRFTTEYKSRKEENIFRDKMLTIAIKNIIIFSLLAIIVLLIGKFKIKILSPSTIIVSLFWYGLQSFYIVLLSFLRALREVGRYGIYNTWQILGGLLLGVLFLLIFNTDKDELFFLILGYVVALIIGLPFLYREVIQFTTSHEPENLITITKHELSYFFNYGTGVTIINLCSQGLSQIDRLFITGYHGVYKSGLYSASYAIAEQSILAIVSIFQMTSTPILYHLWQKQDYQELSDYFGSILRYYLLIITPIALFLIVMYNQIGDFFLDNTYGATFKIIPIVAIGAVLVGYATIYTDILTASKKPYTLMICYIFALLVNIVGNVLLIPEAPFFGGSFSTLMSYFSLLLAVVYFSRKEFKWHGDFKLLFSIGFIAIIVYMFLTRVLECIYEIPIVVQFIVIGLSELIIFALLIFIFKLVSFSEIKQMFPKRKSHV